MTLAILWTCCLISPQCSHNQQSYSWTLLFFLKLRREANRSQFQSTLSHSQRTPLICNCHGVREHIILTSLPTAMQRPQSYWQSSSSFTWSRLLAQWCWKRETSNFTRTSNRSWLKSLCAGEMWAWKPATPTSTSVKTDTNRSSSHSNTATTAVTM